MARKSNGPRQPLSQARPKAAKRGAATTGGQASVPRRGARPISSRGAPPERHDRSALPRARKRPSASGTESAPSGRHSAARAAAAGSPSRRRVHPPAFGGPQGESRAPRILERLTSAYPDARCSLDYRTPFQLLAATILSAQCTDVRVNMVTPALFARYPSPAALADADRGELEQLIKSTGFFRNKAKSLVAMARALVERHGGEVPASMDELVLLPGVGRKTANVLLGNAFGQNVGVVVDTHVGRLSGRLALSAADDPVKIERDLMRLFPQERWTLVAHLLIDHGRAVCDARAPKCEICALADLCPSARV